MTTWDSQWLLYGGIGHASWDYTLLKCVLKNMELASQVKEEIIFKKPEKGDNVWNIPGILINLLSKA